MVYTNFKKVKEKHERSTFWGNNAAFYRKRED
jgi:hypothetical protein